MRVSSSLLDYPRSSIRRTPFESLSARFRKAAVRLNAQLAGQEIASGHAFIKHVVEQVQFADMVESVITDCTDIAHFVGMTDGLLARRRGCDPKPVSD